MNKQNFLSHDYQSPAVLVMVISSDGVLCQSQTQIFDFDGSTMENVDRDVFEW